MDRRAMLMGVGFALMWASAFTSARIIVQAAPPLSALSLRFFVSGLFAVLLARALGQSWRLTRTQWIATIVFGVCQNGLYLGLNFVAMQSVEASLATIIASAMPLCVALASFTLFGERLPALGVGGLVAGVAGVALIMGSRLSGGADPVGVALCLLGLLSLTVATLAVRGASSGGNFLMIVGLQMLIGAAALAGPALAFEEIAIDWSWQLVAAFVYTVVVPGVLATLVWFQLVNRIGATRAAVYHFLTPFFGVAIAAMILGEKVGPLDGIGVAIIAAGILAVQLAKARPARRAGLPSA
ncbi:membrane protein, putative [Oceanicola granulosus HTCC2516]|uniref:Membrane protein, putative n=1 Tax=Oceanicola granulosus (strain ATCC BAA-861 / DSM 15982 / KCTC 12143 / HTCC2516) TaxID=314256 RepID=Q2CK78_OCEGH|nr:DMT family transporter [Oceanicola granulosus]EAR52911.1 membrane protein, putative [Oceanicola granulosus HTCC2516]